MPMMTVALLGMPLKLMFYRRSPRVPSRPLSLLTLRLKIRARPPLLLAKATMFLLFAMAMALPRLPHPTELLLPSLPMLS